MLVEHALTRNAFVKFMMDKMREVRGRRGEAARRSAWSGKGMGWPAPLGGEHRMGLERAGAGTRDRGPAHHSPSSNHNRRAVPWTPAS